MRSPLRIHKRIFLKYSIKYSRNTGLRKKFITIFPLSKLIFKRNIKVTDAINVSKYSIFGSVWAVWGRVSPTPQSFLGKDPPCAKLDALYLVIRLKIKFAGYVFNLGNYKAIMNVSGSGGFYWLYYFACLISDVIDSLLPAVKVLLERLIDGNQNLRVQVSS
jgi:hypothetical protein